MSVRLLRYYEEKDLTGAETIQQRIEVLTAIRKAIDVETKPAAER
ncbi:hypothetical protein [Saccharopolyspora spinosa]|uniref:Uncharacterized protein n=1 Tax=Saccharopolyspora spinosa TaxID=60894 RepID=A0A2N3Y2K4_SACSN|nr:hypothetical protein [Saccharopolyspora spinosa]PKW17137.1 hypothetical protein A8926_5069 [Saccharopolyspora spinosa]